MTEQADVQNETAVQKAIRILEADLNESGWDQPSRIYGISGTLEDPYLILVAETGDHPINTLNDMYDYGFRMPPGALGLCLANEVWRHLLPEEALEIAPPAIKDGILEAARLAFPDEDPMVAFSKAWSNLMMTQAGRPSQQPAALRGEMRIVTVMFLDGTRHAIVRDRKTNKATFDDLKGGEGRLFEALRRFVVGEKPYPEHIDTSGDDA